jgi:hypothetical protein
VYPPSASSPDIQTTTSDCTRPHSCSGLKSNLEACVAIDQSCNFKAAELRAAGLLAGAIEAEV